MKTCVVVSVAAVAMTRFNIGNICNWFCLSKESDVVGLISVDTSTIHSIFRFRYQLFDESNCSQRLDGTQQTSKSSKLNSNGQLVIPRDILFCNRYLDPRDSGTKGSPPPAIVLFMLQAQGIR